MSAITTQFSQNLLLETKAFTLELKEDDEIAGLSDDFKAVVVLRDVADLDYDEIADILDIPVGTVKSRIARGRSALANSLRLDDLLTGSRGESAELEEFSDPGNQRHIAERPTDST